MTTRLLDSDGYPTDRLLELIRKWDSGDWRGLLAVVRDAWKYADWGWRETQRRVYISTAGWSGNESLVGAMQRNFLFWSLHFLEHRTGGHYILERPKKDPKKALEHKAKV